jgi:DNA invertase Pin-like site-specific DNA recombinase
MLIGLARASILDGITGLEAQQRALVAAGAERMFCEHTSSVKARPQLDAAIEFAREGDTLIVTDLSRLAQSVTEFVAVQARLAEKEVHLRVLNLGLDTRQRTSQVIMGRIPTNPAKADEVKRLAASGLPKCKIAQQVGISKRTVFRILSGKIAR